MEVVYIRSLPERPQGGAVSSTASLSPPAAANTASLTSNSNSNSNTTSSTATSSTTTPNTAAHDGAVPHRRWDVSISINGVGRTVTIRDPFAEAEYRTVFEEYLRHSDRPSWSAHNMNVQEGADHGHLAEAENKIQTYGRQLLDQLGLSANSFKPDTTHCSVVVVEHHGSSAPGAPGIHCLAWELLEAVSPRRLPKLRVTRMSGFASPARPIGHLRQQGNHHPPRYVTATAPKSLADSQADPSDMFKVLLVVARDFSRTGVDRDPEPDLAQWPLMNVQRKLRSRLLLEVVRPGSREELEEHLKVRRIQGVVFNLVHFDLHGKIKLDEHNNMVPCLLFTKKDHVSQVPRIHEARAEQVAKMLAAYQVENVVLNACLSAYNRTGSGSSLAHIFLREGIENVSAMWFYVHFQTVATYLDTFYNELLVNCVEFHLAAQLGREAIRKTPTNRTGREYQDFFLCVNYKRADYQRDEHRRDSMAREHSPTPSARSQDSSTSNNSVRSFMSGVWKPSTPRLAEGFLAGSEPVMRMELHLLELEYKLMTFHIVYASELDRAGSNLSQTMDRMVSMWLNTNMVDEVLYYKAKDFAKRRLLTDVVAPAPRLKKTRASNGHYLHLLHPRPVKALRQTLHIVRDVDQVVDPGYQADAVENRRSQNLSAAVQDGLDRFAKQLQGDPNSYLILLGRRDMAWWRSHLFSLAQDGTWWLHVPWNYTLHSRYMRDAQGKGRAVNESRGEDIPLL